MEGKNILILGANGQDGFITSALALGQGYRVTAVMRSFDPRFEFLKSNFETLSVVQSPNYLEEGSLRALIIRRHPNHIFYFASQHGPAKSMIPSEDAVAASKHLNIAVPKMLIAMTAEHEASLTLPASSRVFSALLEGTSGPVVVNAETALDPGDYYGEHKSSLLQLAEVGRKQGAFIHSPILFNHDSMFKRKGYVGWAIANQIVEQLRGSSVTTLRDPNALVDLSDAVEVCELLLKSATTRNERSVVSSGRSVSLGGLIQGALTQMGQAAPRSVESEIPETSTLVGDVDHRQTLLTSRDRTFSALAIMALSMNSKLFRAGPSQFGILKALPECLRGQFPGFLQKFLPVENL